MLAAHDRPHVGRGRVSARRAALAMACAMAACGDGPTEPDRTRLCEIPMRVISPVGTSPGAPALPTPDSPVLNANCLADPPIIRIPAQDSTTIVIPVPRPNPIPLPGGD